VPCGALSSTTATSTRFEPDEGADDDPQSAGSQHCAPHQRPAGCGLDCAELAAVKAVPKPEACGGMLGGMSAAPETAAPDMAGGQLLSGRGSLELKIGLPSQPDDHRSRFPKAASDPGLLIGRGGTASPTSRQMERSRELRCWMERELVAADSWSSWRTLRVILQRSRGPCSCSLVATRLHRLYCHGQAMPRAEGTALVVRQAKCCGAWAGTVRRMRTKAKAVQR
jgi:hypothetical protein